MKQHYRAEDGKVIAKPKELIRLKKGIGIMF